MFGEKTATATGTRGPRQNPVRSGGPKVKEGAPPVREPGGEDDEEEDDYRAPAWPAFT